MLKIGLTGGIGCGKSTATKLFREWLVPVIDADSISHQLVEVGQPLLETLFNQFGHELKQDDGSLDRATLRQQVFADKTLRKQLEALMHPAIRQEMMAQANTLNSVYCILVIPLLIESGMQSQCDRILVVDCSHATQQRRVTSRPGLSIKQFQAIIKSQCSRHERLSKADDIIYNENDDMSAIKEQIQILHQRYLDLSKNI